MSNVIKKWARIYTQKCRRAEDFCVYFWEHLKTSFDMIHVKSYLEMGSDLHTKVTEDRRTLCVFLRAYEDFIWHDLYQKDAIFECDG